MSTRRFVFLAGVLLVIGGRAVLADEQIYKWMDEKGQIHFTATPPPRNARPLGPKPEAKQPMQIVPMPGTPPRSSAPGTSRPRSAPQAIPPQTASSVSDRTDCSRHAGAIQRLKEAQRNVDSLRAALDRIGDDPTVLSRTRCTARGAALDACRSGNYNKEYELERTRDRLKAAEDQLADAEGELRAAGVSQSCMGD